MSYQAPDANQQYNQYPDPGQQGSNPPRAPLNNPYGPQAGYGQPYGPPPGYQYQQPGQGQPYGPPPGYGQPYGQQPGYGQQPYRQPGTLGGLAVTNLPQNVVAALSYVFLWVGALLCLSYAGRNHFLRFHGVQSLFFFGGLTALRLALGFVYYNTFDPVLDVVLPIAWDVVTLVGVVGWFVLVIMAFQGKYFKLPIIGNLAQRYADNSTRQRPARP